MAVSPRVDRRRLENLVAPLAVVVVVGLVVAFLVLRPEPGQEGRPDAEPSSSDPTPSSTPDPSPSPSSPSPDGPGRRDAPLPRADRLGEDLPDPTCPSEPPPRDIRVLSFNIKGATAPGRYDLARIAGEIRASEADVVLLQEIDRFRARSRRDHQPQALAQALGMDWAYGHNKRLGESFRGSSVGSGTAILSRFEILEQGNTYLPNRPGLEQRGLLGVRLQVDDVEIDVYNTHLQHTSGAVRVAQSRALTRIVDADALPTLLGGDFNATPGSAPMRIATGGRMADSWPAVGAGPGNTVPNVGARNRIDYLLHSEEFTPTGARVLQSGISDHRAVLASYAIDTATSCLPPGSVS